VNILDGKPKYKFHILKKLEGRKYLKTIRKFAAERENSIKIQIQRTNE
jgi:hypothetical protein